MKILIANYRYFVSSGPERYLFNVTRHLEERGHTVMPFSVSYSQNTETPYAKYFVPPLAGADEVYFDQHRKTPRSIARTLSRLVYSPEVERAIGRMTDETRPDVAYILYYLRKLSPSLLVGLRKRGVPIVVRVSDYGSFCPELHCLRDDKPCTLCQHGKLMPSIRHRCVKGSLTLSVLEAAARSFHRMRGYFDLIDAFVVTNSFMLEMMVEAGYPREKLVCLPTFTDMEKFSPPPANAERAYLACVGRLDRPKGLPVLLEALALLKARSVETPTLRIAGAGHDAAYVDELRAHVGRLGLKDRVRFMGKLEPERIPEFMRGAIATILPALWFENLPNTLIESMACGTPVIASNIGSLAVSIKDGFDGLLASPGDAAGLADRIEQLLADAGLRERLSRNCRRTALDVYSPETHITDLIDLLQAVRGKSSTASSVGLERAV